MERLTSEPSSYTSFGAVDLSVRSRTVSHNRSRYSKSRLTSILVRVAPAVRRITPIPSGTSSSWAISLSRLRSSMLVILRLMPPPRAVLGINTE